jgi:hypothetical protein
MYVINDEFNQKFLNCITLCQKYRIVKRFSGYDQGFGSGSGLDPDSIGPVDPDPDSGSGSRRAKMTHKSRKFF